MNKENMKDITLLLIFMTFVATDNGSITVDWEDPSINCIDAINNSVLIANSSGYSDPQLQLTHICKADGSLMEIGACNNEPINHIEIIPYFFSLPENDASRQCLCQAKCTNIHRSSYTLKFLIGSEVKYFTISNPCVAFCNKGYEIFLSSYALNSFPDYNGVDTIVKSFDSVCYNRLDDNNKRGRQLSLIKIELCKARIICNLLVNQFIKDIDAIEQAIYGEVLNDDHVLSSEEKYWSKPVEGSDSCIDLSDSGRRAYCMNQYGYQLDFYCFIDDFIMDVNNIRTNIRYPGTILQLNKCVENKEFELQYQASNTGECICDYYYGDFIFSTDIFESIYGNYNDRFLKYEASNFSFQNQESSMNYLKEEYSHGFCECKVLESSYDYLCGGTMYASCIINKSEAISKTLATTDEKMTFLTTVYKNPVDMILGYTEQKCNNLNSLCNNAPINAKQCVYKKYNGFMYPIFKTDSDFTRCVDGIFVNEGNESLNYYFDCPQTEECNTYTCSVEMFSKCREHQDSDPIVADFCLKYNVDCVLACVEDYEKVCIEESFSIVMLASKYDVCVRQCTGIDIVVLCDYGLEDCEITECKELICADCNYSNLLTCPSSCLCDAHDTNCICNQETCNDSDAINKSFCHYPKTTSIVPYKVTEKEKCVNVCTLASEETDYKYCETCLDTPESCCVLFCEDEDDINLSICIELNQELKLVSHKQKCIYECGNTIFTELNEEQCSVHSCFDDCGQFDALAMDYCNFDNNLIKNCFTHKESCLLNCENNMILAVNCDNLNNYECFNNYCNQCFDQKIMNNDIVCHEECKCQNFNLSSFEECSCFVNNCSAESGLENNICLKNEINYQLSNPLEICTKNCKNEESIITFQCNSCVNPRDCCVASCPLTTQSTCVSFDNEYFYSNPLEICEKSCDNILFEEVENSYCCLSECFHNSEVLCVEENSLYLEYDKTVFCNKTCIDKTDGIKIVEQKNCCLSDCLAQTISNFCIRSSDTYENMGKKQYCDIKCNNNAIIELYDDALCCENVCYSEQNQHPSGTYCNESYQIYDSWTDYCIQKRCNGIQENVVFCSADKPCTAHLCKTQIAENLCDQETDHLVLGIKQNGECKMYRNICLRNRLKNQDEGIFQCEYPETEQCLNDPKLFETYTAIYNNTSNRKYCRKNKLISSLEYDFYRKCVDEPSSYSYECIGTMCDDQYCKKINCKNQCRSTGRLFWGYDCNFYESECELNCLGLNYFDFFDISKLLDICKSDPLLFTTHLNLVTLKKNVCLRSGQLKIFSTFVSWIWNSYTDCLKLGSKNMAECKEKCRKWADNF